MNTQAASENILGALIFWAYIAAALFFTALIVNDLITQYTRLSSRTASDKPHDDLEKQRSKARCFAALSVISFSVLSYHMLNFLVQSYSSWADLTSVALPTTLLGRDGVIDIQRIALGLEPWRWSKASTLFQDFAFVICGSPQHFWWTEQALLFSFAWNTYMSIQGARYQVKYLWAYFVLDQILPISFTANLFYTALALASSTPSDKYLRPSSLLRQITITSAYLVSLWFAPKAVDSRWFFFVLFATRALLFAPLLLLKPTTLQVASSEAPKSSKSFFRLWLVAGIAGLAFHTLQTWEAMPIIQTLRSINDSPAVAALGYDYLLAIGSLSISLAI